MKLSFESKTIVMYELYLLELGLRFVYQGNLKLGVGGGCWVKTLIVF